MELYPVRSVFGYSDLAWYLKRWTYSSLSRNWISVQGTIERYELHAAAHNGWLVVFYSYEYGGKNFSGEFRNWVLLYPWSREETVDEIISQFPRGATVRVRVNPRTPAHSAAET